jgi:nucleotide-binding universal stress UspA family protein
MHPYRKVLVCISHPRKDAQMLDYSAAICRLAGDAEVHLLHVAGEPAGPDDDTSITPETLQELAGKHLKEIGSTRVFCEVIQGTPLVDILKYAADKDIDLLVLGGGGEDPMHEATFARRVTRKATCSVLVLPENFRIRADRILVPVRDTECSAQAVEVACDIAKATGGHVLCLNIIQVHSGPARGNLTLEEQIEHFRDLGNKECESLMTRVNTGGVKVECETRPDLYGQVIDCILQAIKDHSTDLLVIGARGRTGAAGVLLGDTTERLIRQTPVPLFAAKKKGEVLGLFQALMTLAGQND